MTRMKRPHMDYDYSMIDGRYNHSSLLEQARASASDGLLLNNFDERRIRNDDENENGNAEYWDEGEEWSRNQRRRIHQYGKSNYLPFGEVETGVKRERENRIDIEMESKRQKTRETEKNDFMDTKAVIAASSPVDQQGQSGSTAMTSVDVNENEMEKDLNNLMIIPFSNKNGSTSLSNSNSSDQLPVASSSDTWIATPWGQIVTSQALKSTIMTSSRFEQRCLRDRTAAPMSSALVLWKGNDSGLVPTACSSSNSNKCSNLRRAHDNHANDSPSNSPNTAIIPYSWDQNRVEIELLPDDDDIPMINSALSNSMDVD